MIYLLDNGAHRPEDHWTGLFSLPDSLDSDPARAFLVAWAGRDSGRASLLLVVRATATELIAATIAPIGSVAGPSPEDFVKPVDPPALVFDAEALEWERANPAGTSFVWRDTLLRTLPRPLAEYLFQAWRNRGHMRRRMLGPLVRAEWRRRAETE